MKQYSQLFSKRDRCKRGEVEPKNPRDVKPFHSRKINTEKRPPPLGLSTKKPRACECVGGGRWSLALRCFRLLSPAPLPPWPVAITERSRTQHTAQQCPTELQAHSQWLEAAPSAVLVGDGGS